MSKAPDIAKLQRLLDSQEVHVDRIRALRALYVAAYNTPLPVEDISGEFFYAVGDLLEGRPPKDLELQKIDKAEMLREYADA